MENYDRPLRKRVKEFLNYHDETKMDFEKIRNILYSYYIYLESEGYATDCKFNENVLTFLLWRLSIKVLVELDYDQDFQRWQAAINTYLVTKEKNILLTSYFIYKDDGVIIVQRDYETGKMLPQHDLSIATYPDYTFQHLIFVLLELKKQNEVNFFL